MNKFMLEAVKQADLGLDLNEGGPFGAVIVKDGKIISYGHNMVVQLNDPTAHAEITAIRKACSSLGRFDLSDCEIYTSCYPCPMCFSAIVWAKIKKVYYGCTHIDAAKIGFDDAFIYDLIRNGIDGKLDYIQIDREECLKPFKRWSSLSDKTQY